MRPRLYLVNERRGAAERGAEENARRLRLRLVVVDLACRVGNSFRRGVGKRECVRRFIEV